MGWIRRVFRLGPRRQTAKSRPWVNPRFLAPFVLAGLALAGFAAWIAIHAPLDDPGTGGAPGAAAQEHREFVATPAGPLVEVLAQALDQCQPACIGGDVPDWIRSAHPDKDIQRVEPAYEQGHLTGYWITYKEN